MKNTTAWCFVACVTLAVPAAATELYRYRDENGVLVISHTIPPSLVHKGYTVVDERNNVIRVVPRELSAGELAAKRAREAEERKQADALQTRKRKDEELMQLYASVADVEAARDRKLDSIEADIGRINANIERLALQKSRLEAQAAERERTGQPASPEILENIRVVETQMEDRGRVIQQRRVEMEQQRANFQYDIERMRILLGEALPVDPVPAQATGVNTAAASSGH